MFLGLCAIGIIALAPTAVAQSHSKDIKGSSDHPVFKNRMPGYYITFYQKQGFGSFKFGTRPPTEIEGTYQKINYYLDTGEAHPGGLAVRRNCENAMWWLPSWPKASQRIASPQRVMGRSGQLATIVRRPGRATNRRVELVKR